MKRKIVFVLLIATVFISTITAHDLFLKLDNFFVRAGDKISINILNGSFQSSEGAVSLERLNDVSLISPKGVTSFTKTAVLTKNDKTSVLQITPDEQGTYVVGLYTMKREIDLKAKDFNEYLEEDGIPDILAERKKSKTLDKNVRELYSKHVKTMFQVGDKMTDNYKNALGYPVEIVPQNNPYSLKIGDEFEFLCLKDGKPLVNQFVMTGYENADGKLIAGKNIRTDKTGAGKVKLNGAGAWYVKFIQMQKIKVAKLDYESKWATLTFAVK